MGPAGHRALLATSLAAALLVPALGAAQLPEVAPPSADAAERPFSLSLGPGVTWNTLQPREWSVTLTLGVGYALSDRWTLTVAPYWEHEIDDVGGVAAAHDELSLSLGASVALSPRWTLTGSVDLGIVSNESVPWGANPEFGVSVGVSWAVPLGGRWALVLGPELSWQVTDQELTLGLNTAVSLDL